MPGSEVGVVATQRENAVSRRGRAAARVRELLRERERSTTAHVRAVVDARERAAALREEIQRLHDQATQGLHGLVEMGYTRAEIAAMCDVTDTDIPRHARAANRPHRPARPGNDLDATR